MKTRTGTKPPSTKSLGSRDMMDALKNWERRKNIVCRPFQGRRK